MYKIDNHNGIIVALATPYGKSAVAIIRISGEGSIELAQRYLSRALKVGVIEYNVFKADKFEEKLMATCYKAPKSYSGEETVELFPHGNMTICDGIIESLIKGGARTAERGEFTKRAFENGKLDLMQCEALADIIDAQTTEQLNYGNKRYDGGFKSLETAEKTLNKALSSVEAVLHYGDEMEENEIDEAVMSDVFGSIDSVIKALNEEVKGYVGGKIVNDGFKVALIGAPNVGKSTLLNVLTDSERAIVTPIAGTTRDTVDGNYIYKDRKFTVVDTAGLNVNTSDEVEKIGIQRAVKAAEQADAVLFVTDNACVEPNLACKVKNLTVLVNKCDGEKDVGAQYNKCSDGNKIRISAKNKVNITAVKQKLYDLCPKDYGAICNHRQYACAMRCLNSLNEAKRESAGAQSLEIVAALLYEAYSAITELYGEQADEKVLDSVFQRFCVGK